MTLINTPTKFKAVDSSNLYIGSSEENGTFVLRLNQGINLDNDEFKGFSLYDRAKISLSSPKNKYWLEDIKYISEKGFENSSVGLATVKNRRYLLKAPKIELLF